MIIIAALLSATVALTVPFISFYLNKAPVVVPNGQATHLNVPVSISWNAKFLMVLTMALVFMVPVGFLSFCVAVVGNLFIGPGDHIFLLSLDAGLSCAAVFASSLLWHAGFNEPLKYWTALKWYPPMMVAFFSSLGFLMALIGNTIWAMAMGHNPT